MTTAPVLLLAVLAVGGYLLAAALSAGETAVGRASRAQLAALLAAGEPGASRVAALLERPVRVSSAAGFVRLLAEMTATVAVTLVVASTRWSWWAVAVTSVVVCAGVAWGLVRVSPRSIGRRHPMATLAAMSGLLSVVTAVFGGLGRAGTGAGDQRAEQAELRDMVTRVTESGAIEEGERQMVRSVFELGETLTREVMVPRTDMVTTSADSTLRSALALLLRSGYSRVPVVGESTDDLRGVLYLKDVVRAVPGIGAAGEAASTTDALDAPVLSLARPASFVPESKPVDDLLRDLRDGSSHMAIVVDEYGGIAGLVTMEDALEEIVGELTDEHDPSAPAVEDLGGGVYRVPARLGRDELGELFGLQVDDEDVDTAGGLLAKALGKVPLPGSTGEIHGLHLQAERVEGRRRRLATVLARRTDTQEES